MDDEKAWKTETVILIIQVQQIFQNEIVKHIRIQMVHRKNKQWKKQGRQGQHYADYYRTWKVPEKETWLGLYGVVQSIMLYER